MSRISITLSNELVDELVEVSGGRSKTQAIIDAIKSEIRRRQIQKILEAAGKMEFTATADDLRHRDHRLG